MKKIVLVLGLLILWSGLIRPSEVPVIKNHIFNWTGAKLRVRCTKMVALKNLLVEQFELRSSGSNTINIFPNTCGYIEITDSFFCDEKIPNSTVLTDSQKKNENIYHQFRITYSWFNSSNAISLKMQKAHQDDILEKVKINDLPFSEQEQPNQSARFFITLLSAEGAIESTFYFRREEEEA